VCLKFKSQFKLDYQESPEDSHLKEEEEDDGLFYFVKRTDQISKLFDWSNKEKQSCLN
jgi:hypothetical protein